MTGQQPADGTSYGQTDETDPRWCEAFTGRKLRAWVIRDDIEAHLRQLTQTQNDIIASCEPEELDYHDQKLWDALMTARDAIYGALHEF